MPNIAALLRNAQALNVHSLQLQTTGKNLSNINNPAYARQRVHIGSLGEVETVFGSQSMGIAALSLQQTRDKLLDRAILRDIGLTNTYDSRKSALLSADSALGQHFSRLDDVSNINSDQVFPGGGLSDILSSFFNAFESWSVRPTDVAEKELLYQKSLILAEKINKTDQRLAQVQADITNQIETDVDAVNQILEIIERLNLEIHRAEAGKPNSAVDLRDQRQQKLEELAKYFDFQVEDIVGSNGQIRIYAYDMGNNQVDIINPTLTGPFLFSDPNFLAGSPSTILNLTRGRLPSLINVRDGAIQDVRNDLLALANQLRVSVNSAYQSNFFSNPPPPGLLIQVNVTPASLNASSNPLTDPSGNDLALAVAQLAQHQFSTGGGDFIDGSFSQFYSATVSRLGLDIRTTDARLNDQKLNEQITRSARDSISGVNQDEELTDMLRFQRAFQASARFTNVLDELLELVANRLGNF
ncbi:MAG: flagellar hook-associated protein FlgK [Chthoniobacterales bacterium]|nr:flagellar hook-associated protein FlgK [Chthoniobacterales bacterium]